ncbi:MAG: AMP-binding protein [Nocardiopsaceae bacterium]|jgi:2-aminobenzoate-CoA ligase|nr:AMP-binding protein [Nocardiopsaceae bacterium]
MTLSPSAHGDTFCRDHLPPGDQWPELTFSLPELRYPDRLNCAEALLDAAVARFGADRPCLLTGTGQAWTYGDLLRRANQAAQVFTADFGLVPGNRVLLRGPNNPWLVAAWFGVLKAGGVVVTTMPLLRPREIGVLASLTRPSLAVCDHRFTGDLAQAVPGLPAVSYGGDDDLASRCAAKDGSFQAVATAADDVALLAPTSGTTGKPKATMHFHRDVLAIDDTFGRHVLAAGPGDVFAGTPPVAFTFGLGGLVVFPLRAGASVLLLERASPGELADAIAAHGVTALFTAPTMYRAMLAAGRPGALTGLRRCVSAGEHLPAAVWEDFRRETGVRIIDGLGSTELLHIFIAAAGDAIRPGSTGVAVPGYEAAVLGGDGKPVPDGTAGHLAVKGPTGCRYLADERQRRYVTDGWNLTGDTYVRDGDGYYWYQARTDDMIITAGYNIAGPEVEQALLTHPDVLETGVVGAPDLERGTIVKAYVVLRDGVAASPAKAAELQDFCKQVIAPYKYPRAVEFTGELPRTGTGKLQRYRLRELAARA